jgi:hypothetical protein
VKFADLIAGLAVVRDERAATEKRLEAARRELSEVKTAAMCKADVIEQLDRYIDECAQMFRANLEHVVQQHAGAGRESFTSIGGGLPLLRPWAGGVDDRLEVAVLAPQLKAAIREHLKGFKCPGTAPLAKRRARRAELEAEIAALTTQLAEIEAAADAARNSL